MKEAEIVIQSWIIIFFVCFFQPSVIVVSAFVYFFDLFEVPKLTSESIANKSVLNFSRFDHNHYGGIIFTNYLIRQTTSFIPTSHFVIPLTVVSAACRYNICKWHRALIFQFQFCDRNIDVHNRDNKSYLLLAYQFARSFSKLSIQKLD